MDNEALNPEKLPDPEDFALVLSVGGNPAPLIASLKYYRPRNAIFIASRETNANVGEILQGAGGIAKYDIITLSDPQNLLDCVRDMREEIPKSLANLKLPPDILLIADITGGTKVMSSALTLAMMEFNSRFTYVGGDKRADGKLLPQTGPVADGHEVIMPMDNPWAVMGFREARSLTQSFNACNFGAARDRAEFLKSRDTEYSAFYEGLANIAEALRCWDIFDYKNARSLFGTGMGRLRAYNNRRHANFMPLYAELQKAEGELKLIAADADELLKSFHKLEENTGRAYLRDLLGNASRCAKKGHYDDAVARLYSAIEKVAKIALARLGIDNSNVEPGKIRQAGGALAECWGNCAGPIQLPLGQSFELLCALAPRDPAALAYCRHRERLEKALASRNSSLLAHGYVPVDAGKYQKLLAAALEFNGLTEADLPAFPEIGLNAILF